MSAIPGSRIDTVANHLRESAAVTQRTIESCTPTILSAADLVADSFRNGGKLLLCGNGGSAADCQHLAAEFTSRLTADFVRPGLPAVPALPKNRNPKKCRPQTGARGIECE